MGKVEDATQSMVRNLRDKTGKTLEAWVDIARRSGAAKHKALVDWLKAKQGLTHGYANLIAHTALAADTPGDVDDLVAAQYAGAKAALRPWYDTVMADAID